MSAARCVPARAFPDVTGRGLARRPAVTHHGEVNRSVRAGLSGVAAAAAAVGVAELVAVGTGPLSAPLLAVGGVVVDRAPAAVKDLGVAVFGVHDKTALISGTAILLA